MSVALSPTAVLARTQRLRREGYILGFEALLNPLKLGSFYIDGEWVAARKVPTHDVVNPATEEVVASVSLGTAEHVNHRERGLWRASAFKDALPFSLSLFQKTVGFGLLLFFVGVTHEHLHRACLFKHDCFGIDIDPQPDWFARGVGMGQALAHCTH